MKAIILAMFFATFPVRFFPLFFCNRFAAPEALKQWLAHVPIAIFSALIAQVLFEPVVQTSDWTPQIPLLLSVGATLLSAYKTRSLAVSMAFGWGFFILLSS